MCTSCRIVESRKMETKIETTDITTWSPTLDVRLVACTEKGRMSRVHRETWLCGNAGSTRDKATKEKITEKKTWIGMAPSPELQAKEWGRVPTWMDSPLLIRPGRTTQSFEDFTPCSFDIGPSPLPLPSLVLVARSPLTLCSSFARRHILHHYRMHSDSGPGRSRRV